MDREELVGYGLLGLAMAARRFDGSHGVPFEAYSAQRVSGAIKDGLRQLDPLSRRERRRFHSGDAEAEVIATMERILQGPLPWDHAASQPDGELTLAETVADPGAIDPAHAIEHSELRDRLDRALLELDWSQRWVIHLRFDLDLTLEETGEQLGVTENRAWQLQKKALTTLAQLLEDDDYREELAA